MFLPLCQSLVDLARLHLGPENSLIGLTARLLKEMNPNLLGDVSIRSIQQLLHDDLNYKSYRARTTPWVTCRQVVKRLKFAKKYSTWTDELWKTVFWSDESTFTVTGTPAAKVYRKPGDDPLKPRFTNKVVKHPASLMVWAGFTYYGVGKLVVLPANEKVNQYNYLELLADYLPDCFEETKAEVFMQDGAPAHTAKLVTDWLRDCEVSYIKDWPGNSPDINPKEYLWGLMKRKLRDMDTSSVPRLESAIRQLWASIPDTTLQNLALSVPGRLQKVIQRKGYSF